ncbi:hypothetical protein PFISCL1PPCAC_22468, partial [Pristionchus fissidentatus]
KEELSDEETSFGRSLALATKIRLMLDEIAARISNRRTDTDVVKALTVLCGFINQDTVKSALRSYERGRVKLYGLKQTRKQQIMAAATLTRMKSERDEAELDRMIEEMEVKGGTKEAEMNRPPPEIMFPRRACHGRKGMLVAQVTCSPDRFVYPEANYCRCDDFARRVLEKRSAYTCVHWLAAWMAIAMGQNIEETPLESLLMMRREAIGVGNEDEEEIDRS